MADEDGLGGRTGTARPAFLPRELCNRAVGVVGVVFAAIFCPSFFRSLEKFFREFLVQKARHGVGAGLVHYANLERTDWKD